MSYKVLHCLKYITLAGIIWTGAKLTPTELAAILKPNEYKPIPTYNDGVIVVINSREQGLKPELYHGFNQRRVNSPTSIVRSTSSKVQVRRTIRASGSRTKNNK